MVTVAKHRKWIVTQIEISVTHRGLTSREKPSAFIVRSQRQAGALREHATNRIQPSCPMPGGAGGRMLAGHISVECRRTVNHRISFCPAQTTDRALHACSSCVDSDCWGSRKSEAPSRWSPRLGLVVLGLLLAMLVTSVP